MSKGSHHRQLIEKARELGCEVRLKKSGHVHIVLPDGTLIVTSSSNPRGRGTANLRARLRRNGVKVP